MEYQKTLMWKEIGETPAMLAKLKDRNGESISALVREVKRRGIRNICAVGRGTSDHALIFFKYATEILSGMTVSLGACSVYTLYDGKLDLGGQLVIGCSQSGQAADVLEVLKHAKMQGAVTVGVTNNAESPIADFADYHLFCDAGEEVSVAATKTFSAQLAILLRLAAELAGAEELKAELDGLSEKVSAAMPAYDALTTEFVPAFDGMKSGFLLSRGMTYPIALEGALKLQETSYVQMKGYPISDFYHGPMAMVGEDTPVFVYIPKALSEGRAAEAFEKDGRACIDRMKEIGAKILLVTDDAELAADYAGKVLTAKLPELGSGALSMFGFALFAQEFACKFSCRIGNNPDSPRALKKVTITK